MALPVSEGFELPSAARPFFPWEGTGARLVLLEIVFKKSAMAPLSRLPAEA